MVVIIIIIIVVFITNIIIITIIIHTVYILRYDRVFYESTKRMIERLLSTCPLSLIVQSPQHMLEQRKRHMPLAVLDKDCFTP